MSTDMTMRCEDVAPYLSAFADGELPEPLQSEVAEHVATCDACAATIARYGDIDALFAGLPRSAPPPEMLDQILDRVAADDAQTMRRDAMLSTWNITNIKHKLTHMEMPSADSSSPEHPRPTQRSRWVSVAIPAIAALLLISVTLVTFHWLPSKGQIFQADQPTATPAPGSKTLADTRGVVNAVATQLSFKPVLPTYLPDGASLANVVIGPHDAEISEHVLDIYWSMSGSVQMIHLREAPARIGLTGYTNLASSTQMAWQIGAASWRTVQVDDFPKNMAIQQQRAGIDLALDVSASAHGPQAAAGQAMLRLISLSMDAPYKVMPAAPDDQTASIVPVQPQDMVAHYSAVALTPSGDVAWREEADIAPCASTADPCQSRIMYGLGADGPLPYTDIASGQRLLHLDQTTQTFNWLPLIPGDPAANLNNTALPKVFYQANTYLNAGILWYLGEANYGGERVYDLLWTNAPTRTHVYVSKATHQVVAIAVDRHAKILKGGPISGVGAQSCLRYTEIAYTAPSATTDALFGQNVPAKYTQGQEQPLTLTC